MKKKTSAQMSFLSIQFKIPHRYKPFSPPINDIAHASPQTIITPIKTLSLFANESTFSKFHQRLTNTLKPINKYLISIL